MTALTTLLSLALIGYSLYLYARRETLDALYILALSWLLPDALYGLASLFGT